MAGETPRPIEPRDEKHINAGAAQAQASGRSGTASPNQYGPYPMSGPSLSAVTGGTGVTDVGRAGIATPRIPGTGGVKPPPKIDGGPDPV